jgi:hypothetical protein
MTLRAECGAESFEAWKGACRQKIAPLPRAQLADQWPIAKAPSGQPRILSGTHRVATATSNVDRIDSRAETRYGYCYSVPCPTSMLASASCPFSTLPLPLWPSKGRASLHPAPRLRKRTSQRRQYKGAVTRRCSTSSR